MTEHHHFAFATDCNLLHAKDFERARGGGESTERRSKSANSCTKDAHMIRLLLRGRRIALLFCA